MKKLVTQNLLRTFLVLVLAAGWNMATAQHWTVNPSDYQYDMSLYAKFMQDGVQIDYEALEVAAFVGDECRGVGTKLALPDDSYVMLMRIRSNVESGETVTFKYFIPQYDKVIPIEGYELPFVAGSVVGLPSEPWIVEVPLWVPVLPAEVTLSKTQTTLLIGGNETLTATISPEDTTDKTLVWASSDDDVATVDQDGNVTALGLGTATITATCGNVSGSCAVTVNPILATDVTLNKTELTLLIGDNETLTATIAPENTTDKTLTWTSSDSEVAAVDQNGKVTAQGVGAATITAACGEASSSCEVTVKPILATEVTLNKTELALHVDESETLTATIVPENTTDKTLEWSSSDPTIASVDQNGTVTALSVGSAVITAKCGEIASSCQLTVNPVLAQSITFSKPLVEIMLGYSEQLTCTVYPENTTDKTLAWSSTDESIVAVDAEGKITALALGTASVKAACGEIEGSCTVIVIPVPAETVTLSQSSLEILIGSSAQLTATVAPDNTTFPIVSWTSSDEAIATVDAEGYVTANGVGSATITATCGNASATCQVVVNPILASEVILDKAEATLLVGERETITATVAPDDTTDKTIVWTSSDTSVATVDENGTITAISAGSATITAACGNASADCQVTVKPIEAESIALDSAETNIFVGETYQLTATVLPENTTDKTVSWTSSDEAIATVDAHGKVTAKAQGSATITATCGIASATCQVTVTKKDQTITWSQDLDNLKVGDEITLEAKASSGLQVAFQIISGSECAVIEEGKLKITAAGAVEVQASQEGNEAYNAAQPVVKAIMATSAIADIRGQEISVTFQNGEITVAGLSCETSIAVYDMAGNLVYCGTEHRVPAMAAKLYIVVAGNRSFKLIAD